MTWFNYTPTDFRNTSLKAVFRIWYFVFGHVYDIRYTVYDIRLFGGTMWR